MRKATESDEFRSISVQVRFTATELASIDAYRRTEKTIRTRSAVVRDGAMKLTLPPAQYADWRLRNL